MPDVLVYWSHPNAGSARVDVSNGTPYALECALRAYGVQAVKQLLWSAAPHLQIVNGELQAFATAAELATPNYPTAAKLDTAMNSILTYHFTGEDMVFSNVDTPAFGSVIQALPSALDATTPAEMGSMMLALEQIFYHFSNTVDPPTVEPTEWTALPELCLPPEWPDPYYMPMIFGLNGSYPDGGAAEARAAELTTIWTANTPGAS